MIAELSLEGRGGKGGGRENSMPMAQALELYKSFRGLQIVKCSWTTGFVVCDVGGVRFKDPMY